MGGEGKEGGGNGLNLSGPMLCFVNAMYVCENRQ